MPDTATTPLSRRLDRLAEPDDTIVQLGDLTSICRGEVTGSIPVVLVGGQALRVTGVTFVGSAEGQDRTMVLHTDRDAHVPHPVHVRPVYDGTCLSCGYERIDELCDRMDQAFGANAMSLYEDLRDELLGIADECDEFAARVRAAGYAV